MTNMQSKRELNLPIAFAAAILLRLCWILTRMARFRKVTGKMLLRLGSAISEASMVTVSVLVGASHYDGQQGAPELMER